MTQEQALSILGGDENQVDEYVTQTVFDLKTNLLKGSIVPQVLRKKAEKQNFMAQALMAMGYEEEELVIEPFELPETTSKSDVLVEFYRSYEKQQSRLKLMLMNAHHPSVISKIMILLADLEEQKLLKIALNFEDLSLEDDVKISDFIDSGNIINELKNSDGTILISKMDDQFPTLKKEIAKSLKYYKFVQQKSDR